MPLEKQQIKKLLSWVLETRSEEIDCEQCLGDMAQFAEAELEGADLDEAMRRVEAHLRICTECTEEFELLLEVLRSSSKPPA